MNTEEADLLSCALDEEWYQNHMRERSAAHGAEATEKETTAPDSEATKETEESKGRMRNKKNTNAKVKTASVDRKSGRKRKASAKKKEVEEEKEEEKEQVEKEAKRRRVEKKSEEDSDDDDGDATVAGKRTKKHPKVSRRSYQRRTDMPFTGMFTANPIDAIQTEVYQPTWGFRISRMASTHLPEEDAKVQTDTETEIRAKIANAIDVELCVLTADPTIVYSYLCDLRRDLYAEYGTLPGIRNAIRRWWEKGIEPVVHEPTDAELRERETKPLRTKDDTKSKK